MIVRFCFVVAASCLVEVMAVSAWADEKSKTDDDYVLWYSSKESGTFQVVRLAGGRSTPLTNDAAYNYWWVQPSPDGARFLVYRSPAKASKDHDDYTVADLLRCSGDGSDQRVLIAKGQNGWRAQGVARWSPDGHRILMAVDTKSPGDLGYQWRMVVTDVEGKNPQVISDRWAIDCNWSPDGKQIAYIGFADNKLAFDFTQLEVHIADYDPVTRKLSGYRRLTTDKNRDHDPSFSPDGKSIVFSAGNAFYTNVNICVFDIAAGKVRMVVDDSAANGGSMCWSPDGKYVYFHSLNLLAHRFQIKRAPAAAADSPVKAEVVTKAPDNSYPVIHPHVTAAKPAQ